MLSTLQILAEEALEQSLQKLTNSPYQCREKPQIILNQRGKIAGAAILQQNIIKLQPKLFGQNKAYFVSDVIPHELAHLLVYQHFGRVKPHGKEWQFMMEGVLGVKAKVTHQLDVSEIGISTFDYQCKCDVIQLSAIRHNRVLKGKQNYICKKCRQTLRFKALK